MPAQSALPDAVRALAEADFGALAQRFKDAGFTVGQAAHGIFSIKAVTTATPQRAAVLVSVGVHGDETGPIEVLAHVLDALGQDPAALAVDLMFALATWTPSPRASALSTLT